MAKFPENGTPAEQAAHMRKWGCGGCQRGALTIDTLAAENAALRAELAFARSTGDESALEYHALKERLAEAEWLLSDWCNTAEVAKDLTFVTCARATNKFLDAASQPNAAACHLGKPEAEWSEYCPDCIKCAADNGEAG